MNLMKTTTTKIFELRSNFLIPEATDRECFHTRLGDYREELFRFADQGVESLLKVKRQLESSLRSVMVRTERLALKADRNGMLTRSASFGRGR